MGSGRDDRTASDFQTLQKRLISIWRSLESRDPSPHTSVVVPSLSFDLRELSKIQGVSFYEERLLFSLIRLRAPEATVVYVTSQPIHPEIIEYYLDLLSGVSARSVRDRLHLLCLYDASAVPLTQKILDRPRVVERIRGLIQDRRRAYLTCFNTTMLERRLALELGIPLNGADPEISWAGTKSGSRRLFDEAGVDQAPGFANLRSESQLLEALAELKGQNPEISRAVVKLNESFAGAGNAIFTYPDSRPTEPRALRPALESMSWTSDTETLDAYLEKLAGMGGIAEAFVEAEGLRSPSAQLRGNPDGSVTLLSTHDQVLGGPTGQTYLGCRFPASESYRSVVQESGLRIGEVLRRYGIASRFGVDFLVYPKDGGWRCLAVEINLRMGGTTAPFMGLQFLTGGRLDPESGDFVSARGVRKFYYATDNLRSPVYKGLLPEDFSDILAAHGLDFDQGRETGAVFHMIGALSQFGKVGVTCIGDSPEEADEIYRRIVDVLDRESTGPSRPRARGLHPFESPAPGME